MQFSSRQILFFIALGLSSGCAGPKPVAPPLTPIPVGGRPSTPPPTYQIAPVVPFVPPPATTPGLTIETNPPPKSPLPTWVSFEEWAVGHGFEKTQRSQSLSGFRYETVPSNRGLVITLGDTVARWHGVEIWLGFAPKMVGGKPALHHLDVEKTLAALAMTPSLPLKSNPVVVIDPGHGGVQVGTRSVFNEHFEKEYALDWAKRLQPLLAANGWTVFLTRSNDVDVVISNRVAFADQVKADLFLSLHFNSSLPHTDQAGIETYCLTPAGMPSNLVRGIEETDDHLLPNNTFDSLNLQYALRLHQSLLTATRGNDRGVRHARFMGVLRGQNRPSVLLEGGYLSNPKEARLIATPEYRQKLAAGVAAALRLVSPARENAPAQAEAP